MTKVMGHRHQFSTSQIYESENDPNWNHMNTEHPFGHMGIVFYTPFSIFFWFIFCMDNKRDMQNVLCHLQISIV